jgi:beta-glucosidase
LEFVGVSLPDFDRDIEWTVFYMAVLTFDSNFEWADGQITRFGVTYVDYKGDHKRYLKKSGMEIGKIFDALIKKT